MRGPGTGTETERGRDGGRGGEIWRLVIHIIKIQEARAFFSFLFYNATVGCVLEFGRARFSTLLLRAVAILAATTLMHYHSYNN